MEPELDAGTIQAAIAAVKSNAMNKAYWTGFDAGQADAALGFRSEYAWFSVDDVNPYASEYSRGYRMGQRTPYREVME